MEENQKLRPLKKKIESKSKQKAIVHDLYNQYIQLLQEFESNKHYKDYANRVEEIDKEINDLLEYDYFEKFYQQIQNLLTELSDIEKTVSINSGVLEQIDENAIELQKRFIEEHENDENIFILRNNIKESIDSIRSLTSRINNIEKKLKYKNNIELEYSNINDEDEINDWKTLNRIKELMQEQGIERLELANKLGIDRSTISQLINNKAQTSLSNAFKLSYIFNKPIEEIFYVPAIEKRNISKIEEHDELYRCNTNVNNEDDIVINNIEIKIKGEKLNIDKVMKLFKNLGEIEGVSVVSDKIKDMNDLDYMKLVDRVSNNILSRIEELYLNVEKNKKNL